MGKGTKFFLIAILVVAVLGLIGLSTIFSVGNPPEIKITPRMPAIGKRTTVAIEVAEKGRGLSHVKIEFVQGQRVEMLADKTYASRSVLRWWGPRTERDTISVDVGRDTISGLKTGEAMIRVTADRIGTWLRSPDPVVQTVNLPVRLAPPTLQTTSTQTYVAQGGCEVVTYRVGDASIRDGVRSGAWWFPGYPLPGGGKQDRFAFFAVPYDMKEPQVRLIAADGAGNEAEASFIDKFFAKPFKTDTIEVTDPFLAKVVPEILSQSPEMQDHGTVLDNYLAINNGLRQTNAEVLKELAKNSQAEFLWNNSFLMMPNGKVMSAFADRRTYRYSGRDIDRQDHLGFDLAVTAHAPIPASNSGVVVVAKYFGIFGNAVVIDHGYGLMSLYGHLSSLAVAVGQKVHKGDILGNTGETGLAGGDHLHFTMLLQGLPVNPVEWWDGHWIQDRIAKKLGPAIHFGE